MKNNNYITIAICLFSMSVNKIQRRQVNSIFYERQIRFIGIL